jgi:hypothetical protein
MKQGGLAVRATIIDLSCDCRKMRMKRKISRQRKHVVQADPERKLHEMSK